MFNNVWVVSIGSTIIVSILGWAIKYLWGRHHSQKAIDEANSYAEKFLRNLYLNYSEIEITKELISSVLDSAARKFEVARVKNLNSVDEIIDDLILEVLETDFVDKDRKSKSVKKIIKLSGKKFEEGTGDMNDGQKTDEVIRENDKEDKDRTQGLPDKLKLIVSYEIVMFTLILVIAMTIFTVNGSQSFGYITNKNDLVMLLIMTALMTLTLCTMVLSKMQHKRKK